MVQKFETIFSIHLNGKYVFIYMFDKWSNQRAIKLSELMNETP